MPDTNTPAWEQIDNFSINPDHTVLIVNYKDKASGHVLLISYTHDQLNLILTWCKAIFKDPKYDNTNACPAGIKYFLSVISKNAISAHLPKIQKGTILLEAKPDIVIPTINDIMGEEVLKMHRGNHTGNKQTHNDEATKELKESNYSLLLAEHQHTQKMKVCNAARCK